MGNLISGGTIQQTAQHSTQAVPTLWEMITHFITQYIFSKVEQDDFLREYLMDKTYRSLFVGWKRPPLALTFQPLPSRIDRTPSAALAPSYVQNPVAPVYIEEYEEESEESIEEETSSSDSEDPGLMLYSMYSRASHSAHGLES